MQDRASRGLSVIQAEYDPERGNTSGWQAVDYKVIVKKDVVQTKTSGGIELPTSATDQEYWTVDTAVVYSMGDLAFSKAVKSDGNLMMLQHRPKVGDRVMVKQNVGNKFTGKDDEEYLIITDKEIVGVDYV